jgi:hypothetical protein
MVGNGATHWDYDVSPSFAQTVFNFHLITKDLYDTFMNNDCHYYFNDVKVYNNSQTCIDAWDKINNLTGALNWYDLYRPTYPGSLLLKSGQSESREGVSMVNGEKKTYKRGMTIDEYTPWLKHHVKNSPILGNFVSDYLNREEVRTALHIPTHVQGW